MRRAVAALVVAAAAVAHPGSPAGAQEDQGIRLILLDQSTFASAERPFRIRVRAVNDTDAPHRDLTLTVAIYEAVRSRSEYAQALEFGPPSPLGVETMTVRGGLPAGGQRRFDEVVMDPPVLSDRDENALYPVTVELRSGGLPLAVLRTATVFLAQDVKLALNVSLSFVLDAPIRMRPDGAFADDALESQVQPGGRLYSIVSSLAAVPVPATLVVSPVLLEQLANMQDGYRVLTAEGVRDVPPENPAARSAGTLLERIRELAELPGTEVVALPYSSPSVPALVEAGLEDELAGQVARGRATVGAILGVEPSARVFRPPASALSPQALPALADLGPPGAEPAALLLDADTLPPPQGLQLTAPGVAQVETEAGPLQAIAPDPVIEDRMTALPEDPRLRARWLIGELSAIYLEQPSVPRGVALVVGEDDAPAPAFLRDLFRALQPRPEAEWLRPVTATLVVVVYQEGEPDVRELIPPERAATLPFTYTAELRRARDQVGALSSMADNPGLLDGLRRLIFLSQSRYLAGHDELRLDLVEAVQAAVEAEFGKVRPPESASITLTSHRGVIPVTLRNEAGYPLRIEVFLRSNRLEFLGGATRRLTLSRPAQLFSFPVQAQATGRFPVELVVQTPSGELIAETTIVVRSTAYNRVALVITIGAALFLTLWWGRRLLSRRTG